MEPDTENAASTSAPPTPDAGEEEGLRTRAEVERLGPCKRRIKAAVPAEVIQKHLDRNYRELASSVQLPGFRRGRVPRKLLEKRFGEEINADLKDTLLSESFSEVLRDHELKLLGEPRFDDVEFRADEDFTYEAEVDVHPEFELPEYKGLDVEPPEIEISEEDVDKQIEAILHDHRRFVGVEPTEAGRDDYFFGRLELYIDGNRVKAEEGVNFAPASGYIGAFAIEDLPGKVEAWHRSPREGEAPTLTLPVVVPSSYPDEILRGKEGELRFVLQDVRKAESPEVDDDFAASLGAENVADLRSSLRKHLEARAVRENEKKIEKELVDRLVSETSITIPDDLVERNRERLQKMREASAGEENGEGGADDVKEEDIRREFKEFLILERIAEKENIVASERDVRDRVDLLASLYGLPPRNLLEQLRDTGKLAELYLRIRNEKVMAFLREKARTGSHGEGDTEEKSAENDSRSEPATGLSSGSEGDSGPEDEPPAGE